jgi:hypothetical protein
MLHKINIFLNFFKNETFELFSVKNKNYLQITLGNLAYAFWSPFLLEVFSYVQKKER